MATFTVNSQNFFNRKKIDNLFDSLHHAYIGMKLGYQGNFWASLIVCKTCSEDLC